MRRFGFNNVLGVECMKYDEDNELGTQQSRPISIRQLYSHGGGCTIVCYVTKYERYGG